MSFEPLTIGSDSYIHVGPGKYMLDGISFGDPLHYLLLKGGTYNSKTGLTTISLSNVIEKDITEGGSVIRRKSNIQVIGQLARGFATTDFDSMLERVSTFASSATLERMFHGEQ